MLGNGFSIDLIKKLQKENEVDLFNLFSKGTAVKWPGTNNNGFLSYKNCKNLWTLGARTTMDNECSLRLIEDIITCANVFNYSKSNKNKLNTSGNEHSKSNNTYIGAYLELTAYLRYLFTYYNSKVTDDELKEIKHPLIEYINRKMDTCDDIVVINYNYDIWLERILRVNNIAFSIEGFKEDKDAKVKIIKPHGSISLFFRLNLQGQFSIRDYDLGDIEQKVEDFNISYDLDHERFPMVSAIIPPAGDANRSSLAWLKVLRGIIQEKINNQNHVDELIIFGMSYWHVDRMEIDEVLTMVNPQAEVRYINPRPSTTFDAVLTSLFHNYIHYVNSELLEGI